MRFYGTRVWDIQAVKGPRRNVVPPRTITDERPGCVPQTPTPGFDVTVTRIFRKDGKQVRTSQFSTHYIPEDDVRCTRRGGRRLRRGQVDVLVVRRAPEPAVEPDGARVGAFHLQVHRRVAAGLRLRGGRAHEGGGHAAAA